MAFRNANFALHRVKFNSAASSDFLAMYENLIDEEIVNSSKEVKHRTFAPSQMRCDRISWFRLRGTEPDKIKIPDRSLEFSAQIGTACHEAIQKRLSENMKADWICVKDWIAFNPEFFKDYEMEITSKGYETLIDLKKPFPVRFACDGIVKFNNKTYLLEIKTSEFSSLQDLTAPKMKHIDQVKCYSTLLNLPDVLFLYQDRTYGEMKCFEFNVSSFDHEELRNRMARVMQLADANIAPEGLPIGDQECTSNMCPYYKKCQEWGRMPN